MKDYLAAIAAKSLGTAGGVAPRLPARFESPADGSEAIPVDGRGPNEGRSPGSDSPPRGAAAWLQELLGSLSADRCSEEPSTRAALEPVSRAADPAADPDVPPTAEAAPAAGRQPQITAPLPQARTPPPPPRSPLPGAGEPRRSAARHGAEPPASSPGRALAPALVASIDGPFTPPRAAAAGPVAFEDRPARAAPRRVPSARARRDPAPPPRADQPPERGEGAARPLRSQPADRNGAKSVTGEAGPTRVVRVVESRAASRGEPLIPAAPRATTDEEPTVQVTIGRLEIRATSPPAPPVRPQPAPPAIVTLDEYLRQCSERATR